MIYILTSKKATVPSCLKIFEIVESFDNIPLRSIVILFSYGKLITSKDLIRYDLYNVHNSILPKYRGLHAFSWAMINGDKEVGYTLHKVDDGVDSGEIVSQVKFRIDSSDTINEVFKKAKEALDGWLANEILNIKNGNFKLTPQNEEEATFVRRRKEKDNQINWNSSSKNIHNLIRAVSPPYTDGAYTFYKDDKLFIEKSSLIEKPINKGMTGQIIAKYKDKGILVKTEDSAILIERINYKGISNSADKVFKTLDFRFYNFQNKD